MTALAQGSGGLALVIGFALLVTGQISTATILLVVQSGAVALTAIVVHQPLMAIPPMLLAGGLWLVREQTPMLDPRTAPVGGAKLGITSGAVLAILCQSLGGLALPSAIVLLAVLLAATRHHPLMQVIALVAAQNGLALAGCLIGLPAGLPATLILPVACFALPLPLAAGLLVPAVASVSNREALRLWMPDLRRASMWPGWIDLGLALAMFMATLIVPLDPLARLLGPLLALDGVMRSFVRRNRFALAPLRRVAALAQSGFMVLAVCAPDVMIAWLAALIEMAMTLLPTLSRRWTGAVLAFLAAGLVLFGLLVLPSTPPILGWFSLFVGLATIAAVMPDLAAVAVILILRLAIRNPWPPAIEMLGIGMAVVALLACAVLLAAPGKMNRTTLLTLSQASIAVLAICLGQANGRFAGLVLLILLILSRSAARITDGPSGTLALAGLAGVPPFGVFPGLVLVVLAVSADSPWLLLPLGVASIPAVWAGAPRHFPDWSWRTARPSLAWLPLVLAVLVGYFAPESLVQWWHVITAGRT
jgi:hypothetical protein